MMMHGQSMMMHGQSMMMHGQSMMMHGQSMMMHGQSMMTHGLANPKFAGLTLTIEGHKRSFQVSGQARAEPASRRLARCYICWTVTFHYRSRHLSRCACWIL